jgi:hypothetical protein
MQWVQKKQILEELGWHCEHPAAAYELLTDPERREIAKKGFMTKELWQRLQPRIERLENA